MKSGVLMLENLCLKAVKVRRNKDQVEIVGIEIIEYEQTSESENTDKDRIVYNKR